MPTMHDPTSGTDRETALQFLKGIGPKRAAALAEEGITTIRDLFLLTPRRYLDRRTVLPLNRIRLELLGEEGLPDQVTAVVSIVRMTMPVSQKGRKRLVIRVRDRSAEADLVFFRGVQYFSRTWKPGDTIAISGVPELFGGGLQWTHPEVEPVSDDDSEQIHTGRIVPIYPQTAGLKKVGLSSRVLRRTIENLFTEHSESELVETLPTKLRARYGFTGVVETVRTLHFPDSESALAEAVERMKYEELLALQLRLARRRVDLRGVRQKRMLVDESPSARALVDRLPFDLTGAQRRVLDEILADMRSPYPMNRLLQGDVGSGKTVVALLAMLVAVDSRLQAALMAPTEILAEQHFRTIGRLLEGTGVTCDLLVGGLKAAARRDLSERLESGELDILVGTHALFQKGVEFKELGLVVIDEQHRFGVKQRAELMKKGEIPDTLIMSATPIPRTLTMTLYGDLDVSVIDELPSNRKPIVTAVRFESEIDRVWDFVRREVASGRQAYVVYPLVDESEALDLKAAEERFELHSEETFRGSSVGLLHGQMLWYEKEDVMTSFLNREIDVLVSTTVIEVGIDVPNATVMVIENAERFGLSQLHQLRGRVGRGSDQSYCILITQDHYRYQLRKGQSQNDQRRERAASIRRLEAMVETSDGFRISEIDLQLRGPGDTVGTRQSGLPDLRYANIIADVEIMTRARSDAMRIIDADPDLKGEDVVELRTLLRSNRRSVSFGDVG